MGCSQTKTQGDAENVPEPSTYFKTDLRTKHKQYVQFVLYMRETQLVAERSAKLQRLIEEYIANNFQFDKKNMALGCIDSVKKLHPIDCKVPGFVTKQWLIDACLRQHKFCMETKVQRITFEHAYPEYLEFLRLCKGAVGTKKITVPTKCQDIIWHSHMQDLEHYQSDMRSFVGIFLNHRDDYPDKDLENYTKQTWARKGLSYDGKKKDNNQKKSVAVK